MHRGSTGRAASGAKPSSRLADLNALLQTSAMISTQDNLITSKDETDFEADDTFVFGRVKV